MGKPVDRLAVPEAVEAPLRRIRRDNPPIEQPAAPDPPPPPSAAPASDPAPEPRAGRGGWAGRLAEWIVPGENPSAVVYGVIVMGALLAAESGQHESYVDTLASALIATGLYWVAHAYSSLLGRRLVTHEHLTPAALRRALAHDWALVRGATVPLLALVCAWAAGAAQQTAVTAALWSSVASLLAFELLAGIRSRSHGGELALEAGVGLAMGLAILALKIVLHH